MFTNMMPGISGFKYPFPIDQSAMFDSASASRMSRAAAGSTDYGTGGTLSFLVKRSKLGVTQTIFNNYNNGDNYLIVKFDALNRLYLQQVYASDTIMHRTSTAVFRDCSNWYHIYVQIDTTQGAAADRTEVYVNDMLITDWVVNTNYAQDWGFINWGSSQFSQNIGSLSGATEVLDGYLSEFNFLPQQLEDLSAFGRSKNGIWIPVRYTGTYNNEDSMHLTFSNSSHFGEDSSGNGNDAADTNMGVDHQVLDSPTNNHCTLDPNNMRSNITALKEGGLSPQDAGVTWHTALGTFLMKTGKWYFEVDLGADPDYLNAGIMAAGEESGDIIITDRYVGQSVQGFSIEARSSAGALETYTDNSGTTTDLPATEADDILQVAFDADANKIWFGQNNTWADGGNPAAGTGEQYSNGDGIDANLYDYIVGISVYGHSTSLANFGQRTFAYTPPAGFKALTAKNISEPKILESNKGIDVVLYEGTGAELAISDLNFTPDFVWIKNRDAADPHHLFDTIRGATKWIEPDVSAVEQTGVQTLKSFNSDGFTLGTDLEINTNGESYVAWCLKMSAKFGFDIQSYVGDGVGGRTVAHNLGAVPELMIIKDLDAVAGWPIYHYHVLDKGNPETDFGLLDLANAWSASADYWNNTAPDASNFTVGDGGLVNTDSENYIAYLWRSVPGFSKVFSYEGNANANGPYVYCGFKPRWILLKNADGVSTWWMLDSARDTYNPATHLLIASIPTEEDVNVAYSIDLFSNGFKIRNSTNGDNTNNNTIVGIAFAEQPGKFSNAR